MMDGACVTNRVCKIIHVHNKRERNSRERCDRDREAQITRDPSVSEPSRGVGTTWM